MVGAFELVKWKSWGSILKSKINMDILLKEEFLAMKMCKKQTQNLNNLPNLRVLVKI